MDKRILIIIMVVAIILLKPQKKEAINLIDNPSFDQGDVGWMESPHVPIGTDWAHLDYSIYHDAAPSMRLDPPSSCGSIGNDRSIWQEFRIDISSYRGETVRLSAWTRHGDCSSAPASPCWVNPAYAGDTTLTNWDCCVLLGICENPAHFQGPWCDINDRGGGRLGMDFYDGGVMFKEWNIAHDWTTPDDQWQYLEIVTDVPEDYSPPGLPDVYNADEVIVWMQGHECASPASVWVDDLALEVLSSDYYLLLQAKDNYFGGDTFNTFITNANGWIQ